MAPDGDLNKAWHAAQELANQFSQNLSLYVSSDFQVIYTDSRFKSRTAMAPFPNLKRHLDQFVRVITSDNHPYGLHRARDEKFFLGEKIVSLRKCAEPTFTFTDFPCYVSQTFNIITTNRANLLFLTGVLNSRFSAVLAKASRENAGTSLSNRQGTPACSAALRADREGARANCEDRRAHHSVLAKERRRIYRCGKGCAAAALRGDRRATARRS